MPSRSVSATTAPASRLKSATGCFSHSSRQSPPARGRASDCRFPMTSSRNSMAGRSRSRAGRACSRSSRFACHAGQKPELRHDGQHSGGRRRERCSRAVPAAVSPRGAARDLRDALRQLGRAALEKLAGGIEPELIVILSDINMPGMDGLALLREIKVRQPNMPVMMVTAYGDDERRRRAEEYGAAQFITKPVDFDLLKAQLRELPNAAD